MWYPFCLAQWAQAKQAKRAAAKAKGKAKAKAKGRGKGRGKGRAQSSSTGKRKSNSSSGQQQKKPRQDQEEREDIDIKEEEESDHQNPDDNNDDQLDNDNSENGNDEDDNNENGNDEDNDEDSIINGDQINEELVCNEHLQVTAIDEAVFSDVDGNPVVASSLPLSSTSTTAAVVPADVAETTASVAEDKASSIVAGEANSTLDGQDHGATVHWQEPAGPSVAAGGEDGASHSESVTQAEEAQAVAPVAASGSGGGGPKVFATPGITKELEPHHRFTIHLDVNAHRWQGKTLNMLPDKFTTKLHKQQTFSKRFGTAVSWQDALREVHAWLWEKWLVVADEYPLMAERSVQTPGVVAQDVLDALAPEIEELPPPKRYKSG